MNELLARLKFERWYQIFVAVGAVGAIAALTVEVKAVSGAHALLVFLGMFLLGVGELINHPLSTRYVMPRAQLPAGVVYEVRPRVPRPGGLVLDAIGMVLFAVGLAKIVVSA